MGADEQTATQDSTSRLESRANVVERSQKRSIACDRCHAQKIKCSGEKLCSRCRRAGHASSCRYVYRDRKVRVHESYLEQLIQDSQALHARQAQMSAEADQQITESSAEFPLQSNDNIKSVAHDHTAGQLPWFQSHDASALPIYISEAACTAFATRLCQCLKGSDTRTICLPKGRYTDEAALSSLTRVDIPWPGLANAKLLVKTALCHINPAFHIVLRKDAMDVLHMIYQERKFDNQSLKCKYFALFAIGQAYSTRHDQFGGSTDFECVPGSAYFARALNIMQIIPERPSMIHIESLLLLAMFCQFLNRFHSSYLLVGNALRLSVSVGLNYNVPQSQNLRPIDREHRVRIWWTIYVLDRFWGCKSGFPVQIHDDDVHVDLPSTLTSQSYSAQFPDTACQIVAIELARITGNTTREIYNRKKSPESFLQREQKLLIQMQKWVQSLPEHIRLHPDKPNSKYTVHIHLQFNYCLILALRPVLLNLLICHIKSHPTQSREITPILAILSGACIGAARYSFKLCLEEWTSGSFAFYGYAFPAYVFSSALALTISSLLPLGSPSDIASVETAMEMLRVLSCSQNLAAMDLYEHLQRVQQCLQHRCSGATTVDYNIPHSPAEPVNEPAPRHNRFYLPTQEGPSAYASLADMSVAEAPSPDLTTETALDNPPMADFLTQSAAEVGFLSVPEISNDFDMAFMWSDDAFWPQ